MELKNVIPDYVQALLDRFFECKERAYVVGGSVRDLLLGSSPHDYDIACSAPPERVKEIFSDFPVIPTGEKHGTVTVVSGGENIEITTFRRESGYSDSRHPDSVEFVGEIEEDLSRRDFTINAMALSPTGEVIDPFGGNADIENGVIRCVGNPVERFTEDPLRILRALRFSSTLGFAIEEKTKKAALEYASLLSAVSAERKGAELSGIVCGKNAGRVVSDNFEIICAFLPELLPMKGFEQDTKYHLYDVLEHTVRVVDAAPRELHMRLAALFHDSGKPSCFTRGEDGSGHFHGHQSVGADIAKEALSRLRFDKSTIEKVALLIKYHDIKLTPDAPIVKRIFREYCADFFFDLLDLQRADNAGKNPEFDKSALYDKLEDIAREIIGRGEPYRKKDLDLTGDDLIELGMKEGKEIGEALDFLLDAIIDEKVANDREKMVEYLRNNYKKQN